MIANICKWQNFVQNIFFYFAIFVSIFGQLIQRPVVCTEHASFKLDQNLHSLKMLCCTPQKARLEKLAAKHELENTLKQGSEAFLDTRGRQAVNFYQKAQELIQQSSEQVREKKKKRNIANQRTNWFYNCLWMPQNHKSIHVMILVTQLQELMCVKKIMQYMQRLVHFNSRQFRWD